MSDIYSAPRAELSERATHRVGGSVESALLGDYNVSIRGIIAESWQRTKGAKLTIHGALMVYMLVYILVIIVPSFLLGFFSASSSATAPSGVALFTSLWQFIAGFLMMPMSAGLFMIGLKRASDAPISYRQIFDYFRFLLPLVGAVILIYLFIVLGLLLLVLPGLYLIIAYYLAIPLIVEKQMGVWQALETSRKATTKHWFKIFALGIVIGLLNLVAMIPLTLGLIWTIPMSIIAYGILYRDMFGVESTTL